MSQNSTPTTLPTARKSRRASQRNRPVLVSSTSQGTQEIQENQIETLEPETSNTPIHTEPLAEKNTRTETPEVTTNAKRSLRLPGFFSKVEKTVEEPAISEEEVVNARLARAKKTFPKTEVKPAADETREHDEKPARGTNRTAATARPNRLFKTRHFIGMLMYLFGAEILLPLEANLFQQLGIEQTLTKFTFFVPITITTSVLLNMVTLVVFLLVLVKFDLLPSTISGKTAATTRAQQQKRARDQQAAAERAPQPTVRQGVKGEHDDLYQAYRSNQRRDKKR
jgi:hypothetical protein